MKRVLFTILKTNFIHQVLIKLIIIIPTAFICRVSEKSFAVRLKKKGYGGYLGDTIAHYPENISIGDNCTFGGEVILNGFGGILIGDNCMIATRTIITTATHDYSLTPMNVETKAKNVTLGDNIWVGTGAIILPGITIADGTVIAAGSVVTKSIYEPNLIYGGVPAKFIKKRI